MSYRFHGNYCGPNWSAGEYQQSVESDVGAIDQLDQLCKLHDAAYYRGTQLAHADYAFATGAFANFTPKSLLAGALVGTQGTLRFLGVLAADSSQSTSTELSTITNMAKQSQSKKSLRGSMPPASALGGKSARKAVSEPNLVMSRAPTAIGSTIRSSTPKIVRSTDSARVSGHDFLGTVEGNGLTTFGVGKVAALSPAYFPNSMIGSLASTFDQYKWNRLRIHYIPKVPTTLGGQVVLTSSSSVSEPTLQPESGTFLQRAMTQGNAVFSPLWMATFIDIPPSDWKLLDPATTADPDDTIAEELQVFTQVSGVAQQVGYLWAEYDVSFKGATFSPHSTMFPIPTGPGVRCALTDSAAVNAVGNAVTWTEVSSLGTATVGDGTIYKFVMDIQGSTPAAPTTFGNTWNAMSAARSNATTLATTTKSIPIVGGMTLYIVAIGTSVYPYLTLDAAINGVGSGALLYRTLTAAAGSYSGDAYLIKYAPILAVTVQ